MRNKRTLILASIAGALLVAAGVEFALIWHQGDIARQNANKLLAAYNSAVPTRAALSSIPPSSPAISSSALPTAPAGSYTPAASVPPGDYVRPDKPDVDPGKITLSLPGYDVIGKLVIPKIKVELPVIAQTTEAALRVSVCFFDGALPGDKGNMVITGHDYANGAHFGRLSSLAVGDPIEFDAPDGTQYSYVVYEMVTVRPDDTKALEVHEGDYGLTLVTCTDNGNRRLLVRCKKQ